METRLRLRRELQRLQKDPIPGIKAEPVADDIYHWKGSIAGPEDTPYEGGIFKVTIRFPPEYPFRPPKVCFNTPIFHPNISENGSIGLDLLKDLWTPLGIAKTLLSISALLYDPNVDDCLRPRIARMYKVDKARYNATAKRWTEIYA